MKLPCVVASRCAYHLLVFLVMLANCFFISKIYFEYRVIVKAGPLVPFDLNMPKLSLCFSLSSLLSSKSGDFFFTDSSLFLNKKISELKENTPAEHEVIEDCMYRDWQTDSILISNKTECERYFSVTKFVMQSYMCYMFTPHHKNFTFFDVTHTLEQRRLLYQVKLKVPLNSGHKMCPMLHYSDLPYNDRVFAEEIIPLRHKGGKFSVSNDVYDYSFLSPPYTNCSDISSHICYNLCMMKQLERFGLLYHSASMFNKNDSLIMPDFESKYSGRLYTQIHAEAKNICSTSCPRRRSCQVTIASTITSRLEDLRPSELTFQVSSIMFPVTMLKMVPENNLIEFLTQLASVCSFTVGFSFLALVRKGARFEKRKTQSLLKHMISARVQVALMKLNLTRSARVQRPSAIKNGIDAKLPSCLSHLVRLFVVIALSSQLYQISSDYFSYQTRVRIVFNYWPEVTTPQLNICPLNESSDQSVTLNQQNYDEILSSIKDQSALHQPLPNEDIISACRIRTDHKSSVWQLAIRNKSECLNHFTITRYLMEDNFCYGIRPKEQTTVLQEVKKFAIIHPGLFYSVMLDPPLAKKETRIVLSNEQLPVVSMDFAGRMFASSGHGLFVISNHLKSLLSLPPPYDTRCRSIPSRKQCARLCLINGTISQLDSLPFGQLITNETLERYRSHKLLSYRQLKQPKINQVWRQIESDCESRCDYVPCKITAYKTIVSTEHRSDRSLELAVDSRAYPDEYSTVQARSSLYTMMYQILCSANFWLGLMFLDLNPFKTRREKLRKQLIATVNDQMAKFYLELRQLHQMLEPVSLHNRIFNHSKLRFVNMKRQANAHFKLILTVFCCLHLYDCVQVYLRYPTIMITYNRPDEQSLSTYELNVCSSILDSLVPSEVGAFFSRRISRADLDSHIDRALNKTTVSEMLAREQNNLNSLDSCSYRGLGLESNSSDCVQDLTNRLFLEHNSCNESLYSRITPANGFLCHRFGMKREVAPHRSIPLNQPRVLLAVKFKIDKLSRTLAIAVNKRNVIPYYTNFWSPRFKNPRAPSRLKLSYVKYEQEILLRPYDNDFASTASIACFQHCLNDHLYPFGLGVVSAAMVLPNVSVTYNFRYPTKQQLNNASFIHDLRAARAKCRTRCVQTIGQLRQRGSSIKQSFTVTLVVDSTVLKRRTEEIQMELVLLLTDSFVTQVKTEPQWSFFELVINCGSIISMWFGVSALSLDPLQSREDVDHNMVKKVQEKSRQIKSALSKSSP